MVNTSNAGNTVAKPIPKNVKKISKSAYEGMARPRLAIDTVRNAPRPVWPMTRPTGMAITDPTRTTKADSQTCSNSRFGIPFMPVQLAGSVNQSTSWLSSTSAPPRPGRGDPSERQDGRIGDEGQPHRHDGADINGGVIAEIEAAQHQVAEPALADESR